MLWFAAATILAAALLYWWLREPQHGGSGATTPTRPLQGLRDLQILYGDRNAEITERVVTLTAVEFEPQTGRVRHFEGFCHLRREKRMFRPARVLNMTDLTTGEKIEDVDSFLVRWSHQNRRM